MLVRKKANRAGGRKASGGDAVVGIGFAVRSRPQLVDGNKALRHSDAVNNATDTLTNCQ
jgi:hypothetical protein